MEPSPESERNINNEKIMSKLCESPSTTSFPSFHKHFWVRRRMLLRDQDSIENSVFKKIWLDDVTEEQYPNTSQDIYQAESQIVSDNIRLNANAAVGNAPSISISKNNSTNIQEQNLRKEKIGNHSFLLKNKLLDMFAKKNTFESRCNESNDNYVNSSNDVVISKSRAYSEGKINDASEKTEVEATSKERTHTCHIDLLDEQVGTSLIQNPSNLRIKINLKSIKQQESSLLKINPKVTHKEVVSKYSDISLSEKILNNNEANLLLNKNVTVMDNEISDCTVTSETERMDDINAIKKQANSKKMKTCTLNNKHVLSKLLKFKKKKNKRQKRKKKIKKMQQNFRDYLDKTISIDESKIGEKNWNTHKFVNKHSKTEKDIYKKINKRVSEKIKSRTRKRKLSIDSSQEDMTNKIPKKLVTFTENCINSTSVNNNEDISCAIEANSIHIKDLHILHQNILKEIDVTYAEEKKEIHMQNVIQNKQEDQELNNNNNASSINEETRKNDVGLKSSTTSIKKSSSRNIQESAAINNTSSAALKSKENLSHDESVSILTDASDNNTSDESDDDDDDSSDLEIQIKIKPKSKYQMSRKFLLQAPFSLLNSYLNNLNALKKDSDFFTELLEANCKDASKNTTRDEEIGSEEINTSAKSLDINNQDIAAKIFDRVSNTQETVYDSSYIAKDNFLQQENFRAVSDEQEKTRIITENNSESTGSARDMPDLKVLPNTQNITHNHNRTTKNNINSFTQDVTSLKDRNTTMDNEKKKKKQIQSAEREKMRTITENNSESTGFARDMPDLEILPNTQNITYGHNRTSKDDTSSFTQQNVTTLKDRNTTKDNKIEKKKQIQSDEQKKTWIVIKKNSELIEFARDMSDSKALPNTQNITCDYNQITKDSTNSATQRDVTILNKNTIAHNQEERNEYIQFSEQEMPIKNNSESTQSMHNSCHWKKSLSKICLEDNIKKNWTPENSSELKNLELNKSPCHTPILRKQFENNTISNKERNTVKNHQEGKNICITIHDDSESIEYTREKSSNLEEQLPPLNTDDQKKRNERIQSVEQEKTCTIENFESVKSTYEVSNLKEQSSLNTKNTCDSDSTIKAKNSFEIRFQSGANVGNHRASMPPSIPNTSIRSSSTHSGSGKVPPSNTGATQVASHTTNKNISHDITDVRHQNVEEMIKNICVNYTLCRVIYKSQEFNKKHIQQMIENVQQIKNILVYLQKIWNVVEYSDIISNINQYISKNQYKMDKITEDELRTYCHFLKSHFLHSSNVCNASCKWHVPTSNVNAQQFLGNIPRAPFSSMNPNNSQSSALPRTANVNQQQFKKHVPSQQHPLYVPAYSNQQYSSNVPQYNLNISNSNQEQPLRTASYISDAKNRQSFAKYGTPQSNTSNVNLSEYGLANQGNSNIFSTTNKKYASGNKTNDIASAVNASQRNQIYYPSVFQANSVCPPSNISSKNQNAYNASPMITATNTAVYHKTGAAAQNVELGNTCINPQAQIPQVPSEKSQFLSQYDIQLNTTVAASPSYEQMYVAQNMPSHCWHMPIYIGVTANLPQQNSTNPTLQQQYLQQNAYINQPSQQNLILQQHLQQNSFTNHPSQRNSRTANVQKNLRPVQSSQQNINATLQQNLPVNRTPQQNLANSTLQQQNLHINYPMQQNLPPTNVQQKLQNLRPKQSSKQNLNSIPQEQNISINHAVTKNLANLALQQQNLLTNHPTQQNLPTANMQQNPRANQPSQQNSINLILQQQNLFINHTPQQNLINSALQQQNLRMNHPPPQWNSPTVNVQQNLQQNPRANQSSQQNLINSIPQQQNLLISHALQKNLANSELQQQNLPINMSKDTTIRALLLNKTPKNKLQTALNRETNIQGGNCVPNKILATNPQQNVSQRNSGALSITQKSSATAPKTSLSQISQNVLSNESLRTNETNKTASLTKTTPIPNQIYFDLSILTDLQKIILLDQLELYFHMTEYSIPPYYSVTPEEAKRLQSEKMMLRLLLETSRSYVNAIINTSQTAKKHTEEGSQNNVLQKTLEIKENKRQSPLDKLVKTKFDQDNENNPSHGKGLEKQFPRQNINTNIPMNSESATVRQKVNKMQLQKLLETPKTKNICDTSNAVTLNNNKKEDVTLQTPSNTADHNTKICNVNDQTCNKNQGSEMCNIEESNCAEKQSDASYTSTPILSKSKSVLTPPKRYETTKNMSNTSNAVTLNNNKKDDQTCSKNQESEVCNMSQATSEKLDNTINAQNILKMKFVKLNKQFSETEERQLQTPSKIPKIKNNSDICNTLISDEILEQSINSAETDNETFESSDRLFIDENADLQYEQSDKESVFEEDIRNVPQDLTDPLDREKLEDNAEIKSLEMEEIPLLKNWENIRENTMQSIDTVNQFKDVKEKNVAVDTHSNIKAINELFKYVSEQKYYGKRVSSYSSTKSSPIYSKEDENVKEGEIKKNVVKKDVNIKENIDVDPGNGITKEKLNLEEDVNAEENTNVKENVNVLEDINLEQDANVKESLNAPENIIIKEENVILKEELNLEDDINAEENVKENVNVLEDINLEQDANVKESLNAPENIIIKEENVILKDELNLEDDINAEENVKENVNVLEDINLEQDANVKESLNAPENIIIKEENVILKDELNLENDINAEENMKKNVNVIKDINLEQDADVEESTNLKKDVNLQEHINLDEDTNLSQDIFDGEVIKCNSNTSDGTNLPNILNVQSISLSLFENLDNTDLDNIDTLSQNRLELSNENKEENSIDIHDNSEITKDDKEDNMKNLFCVRCKRKSTDFCQNCMEVSYCSKHCSKLHWRSHHYRECKGHNVDIIYID